MRFLKWLLGIIVIVVVAVLVTGYIFLKDFDLNKYKSYAEKIVYEQTGRTLEVKGDASLGISLIPTIIVNDVSLSNPSWAKNPQMLKVGSLELKFSLLPLLKKQIVVDKAILTKAQVYLETAADGRNNWTFEPIKQQIPVAYDSAWLISSANASEIPAAKSPDFLSSLSDIVAHEVAIYDGSVQYLAAKSAPIKLKIKQLLFSADGIDAPMNLSWDINFNDMDLSGKGTFGSLSALFDSAAEFPADADVTALGIKAQIQAKIRDIMNNPAATFSLNVNNPAGNMNAPAATLVANGKADMKKVELKISNLTVAGNKISGTVSADIASKIPFVKADLTSPLINVTSFATTKKTVFNFPELISSAAASQLVPDEAIPYNLLKTLNGDFKIKVSKLIVNDAISADDVRLTAGLQSGVLTVNPLQLKFGNGDVNLIATLNAANQSVVLKLNSRDVVLQSLHKEFLVDGANDFGVLSGGQSQLYADLTGSGGTYRALVDSLNGQVIAIVDKSQLQSGKLRFMTGNFITQLFSVLKIDTSKSETVDLKCAVIRADLKDGKADFPRGIAVDSDKLNLTSAGTLNLRNDKISLSLNAYRNGLGDMGVMQALSNLIQIKGTLENPQIALDKNGAVKTIAGVAAGLAAGPAYAGTLLLDRDSAPCYTALKGTIYKDKFPGPSAVTGAAQNTYQDASQIVGDVGTVTKDTVKAIKNDAKNILKGFLNK